MGGFNPSNALLGAPEGFQTQTLPNTVIPNGFEPCYPRIWATGGLAQDIRALQGNVIYYTNATTATVTVTHWNWYAEEIVGTETGAGGYVEQARGLNDPQVLRREFAGYAELTDAEKERYAAQVREVQERAERERERRELAAETAERLLVTCLNEDQINSWLVSKSFFVETNGRRYLLAHAHEPRRLDAAGLVLFTYCIHIPFVPRCDELLGFKLLLEADEEQFLSTANATATRHGLERGGGQMPYPVPPRVQLAVAA